jgi:hypothetical protein
VIRQEHDAAIKGKDDVKQAIVGALGANYRAAREGRERPAPHRLAEDAGQPTLADINNLFELTREVTKQRESRHPIEARQFREFLKTVQPTPSKSMVLRLATRGKAKVA